jgi:ribosomal-protein-alanine N-acetyltransferase
MVDADLAAVAAIEGQEFSAWSEASIASELQRVDSLPIVICSEDTVVGWGCCRHTECEAELLKIGVTQSLRRRGLGSILLDTFISELQQRRISELFLEVRSLNHPALSFYLNSGFTEAGRRINYYRQPSDDALVLKKSIQLEKEGE